LLRNELENEEIWEKIEKKKDFDINASFKGVDNKKKGFLTCEDFEKVLNKNGVYGTEIELKGLWKRYDRDEDGKVWLEEFIQEMKPKTIKKSDFL